MGLFSFLREAGKKIFKSNDEVRKADPSVSAEAIRQQQIAALRAHVQSLGLNVKNLDVHFDAADGEIVLTGEAASRADYEKAALMAGNVAGIFKVDNNMTLAPGALNAQPELESDTYEVKQGDTLWAIAEHFYHNGAKYKQIVEANQPMIKNENEIYPGQVLRIPKQTA